jgi:hypothetical protein
MDDAVAHRVEAIDREPLGLQPQERRLERLLVVRSRQVGAVLHAGIGLEGHSGGAADPIDGSVSTPLLGAGWDAGSEAVEEIEFQCRASAVENEDPHASLRS